MCVRAVAVAVFALLAFAPASAKSLLDGVDSGFGVDKPVANGASGTDYA